MSEEKSKVYNFQQHHVFAKDLFKNASISDLLNATGIQQEALGNKVALLTDLDQVAILQSAPEAGKAILFEGHSGVNRHQGSHPGYTFF